MAFGGRSWPINVQDMNLGQVSTDPATCVEGIFDKRDVVANVWSIGSPFLRSVYSVFDFQPLSIGFARLSIDGGGTTGGCCSLISLFYLKRVLPGVPRNGNGSENAGNLFY